MPIIEYLSPEPAPPEAFLKTICDRIQVILQLAHNHVWSFWHPIDPACFFKPDWEIACAPAPLVKIRCKSTYSNQAVQDIITCVANGIVEVFGVNRDEIYIVVDRVHPDHLFVRGQLWNQ